MAGRWAIGGIRQTEEGVADREGVARAEFDRALEAAVADEGAVRRSEVAQPDLATPAGQFGMAAGGQRLAEDEPGVGVATDRDGALRREGYGAPAVDPALDGDDELRSHARSSPTGRDNAPRPRRQSAPAIHLGYPRAILIAVGRENRPARQYTRGDAIDFSGRHVGR
jgi:hypothetical protein